MDFSSILKSEIAKQKATLPNSRYVKSSTSNPQKRPAEDVQESKGKREKTSHPEMPEEKVIDRLRAFKEPIRLFGESDEETLTRLNQLIAEKSTESLVTSKPVEKRVEKSIDLSTEKKRQEQDALLQSIDTSSISPQLLQKDPEQCQHLLSVYLKKIVRAWEKDLEHVDVTSKEGKSKYTTMKQVQENIRPLLKLLKKHGLEKDVLTRVTEIVDFIQQREYVNANNSYLVLSIGNAPWPIGVTAVGIHARSSQQKIEQGKIAHALNDETTRKWIQSLKRIMTWAQDKYPPDQLSKRMG